MGKMTFSDVEQFEASLIDIEGKKTDFVGQVRNYELQKSLQQLHFDIQKMEEQYKESCFIEQKQEISEEILKMKNRIMGIIFNEDANVFEKYSGDLIDAVIKAYGEYNSKKFLPKEEIKN